MQDYIKNKITEVFNDLHAHPEISWEEKNTTEYIKKLLINHDCKVRTFHDSTGVIGEIGSGGKVVALRADMDALWQEVDGEFKAVHSCGHDAHMAIVTGVLFELLDMESLPAGTVRFIFQPAEEKGTGALKLAEEGVLDGVDYLFGVHLRPIQEMRVGKASPSILHGAAKFITGKIIGDDTHGARPHLGTNAIEVGAAIVGITTGIHLDPMIPYSIKMTSFHAGGQSQNIIPGNAVFSLDLRSQTNEGLEKLDHLLQKRLKALESYYDVKVELETNAVTAAAMTHQEAEDIMYEAIVDVLGKENVDSPIVTTGGDDFHFYTKKKPELKATMLGLGCDLSPGLHHPKMQFDHEAILKGTSILTRAVLKALSKD